MLERVDNVFSEKLEDLYTKLATLRQLETATPLPPSGQVGKLQRPIALMMRKDQPLYTSTAYNQYSPSHLAQHASTIQESHLRGINQQGTKPKSMMSLLKHQLGKPHIYFLVFFNNNGFKFIFCDCNGTSYFQIDQHSMDY